MTQTALPGALDTEFLDPHGDPCVILVVFRQLSFSNGSECNRVLGIKPELFSWIVLTSPKVIT